MRHQGDLVAADQQRLRACRRVLRRLLVGVLLLCAPVRVLAWGERAHRMINVVAIENLPEPLRAYFQARQAFLVEHASEPDRLGRADPAERPHHYTEIEAYDSFPFGEFRRQFVEERMGSPSPRLEHGDSIWQIEQFTLRLTEDLRRGRWEDADHAALFAAHYAADLTQPLHTVINYDGQLTGQRGIHARFESELVNALGASWVLRPNPPVFETDLRARIFQEMIRSYAYRYVVFAADNIAVSGRSYVDPQYTLTFRRLAGPLARKQLEAAASFVSSLWYTAWVRAGRVKLPSVGLAQSVPATSRPSRQARQAGRF